jgi:hypothetical protein
MKTPSPRVNPTQHSTRPLKVENGKIFRFSFSIFIFPLLYSLCVFNGWIFVHSFVDNDPQ